MLGFLIIAEIKLEKRLEQFGTELHLKGNVFLISTTAVDPQHLKVEVAE